MRIAIVGCSHETNTFALEHNDQPDAGCIWARRCWPQAHPKSYIGGFVEAPPRRCGIGPHRRRAPHPRRADPPRRSLSTISASSWRACARRGRWMASISRCTGRWPCEPPYTDAEASLIRAVRLLLGDTLPMVATYDFHGIYTDWEVSAVVPFPLNTNPHIDAYERGVEAGENLLRMLAGRSSP